MLQFPMGQCDTYESALGVVYYDTPIERQLSRLLDTTGCQRKLDTARIFREWQKHVSNLRKY